MPNWVTNVMKIEPTKLTVDFEKELDELFEAISTRREESIQHIDFDKISPMPKELKETRSPMQAISQEEYDKQEERFAKNDFTEREKVIGMSRCLTQELIDLYNKKFGASCWYQWNLRNWGTKWNTCDTSMQGNKIFFQTAWSTPVNVILTLSKKFPNLKFEVKYADEDFGQNLGTYECINGDIFEQLVESGTEEAYEFAEKLTGAYVDQIFDYDDEEAQEVLDNDETYIKFLIKIAQRDDELHSDLALPFLKFALENAIAKEEYEDADKINKIIEEQKKERELSKDK